MLYAPVFFGDLISSSYHIYFNYFPPSPIKPENTFKSYGHYQMLLEMRDIGGELCVMLCCLVMLGQYGYFKNRLYVQRVWLPKSE